MSWRVIFTGAICLLLAGVIGTLAFIARREAPWLTAVAAAVDVGIIFGGLKTVLETTKTANELRRIGLELEKLRLEIGEKKRAAEKEGAYLTVATLHEIEKYAPTNIETQKSSRWIGFSLAISGAGVAMAIVFLLSNTMNRSHHSLSNGLPNVRLDGHSTYKTVLSCKSGNEVLGKVVRVETHVEPGHGYTSYYTTSWQVFLDRQRTIAKNMRITFLGENGQELILPLILKPDEPSDDRYRVFYLPRPYVPFWSWWDLELDEVLKVELVSADGSPVALCEKE